MVWSFQSLWLYCNISLICVRGSAREHCATIMAMCTGLHCLNVSTVSAKVTPQWRLILKQSFGHHCERRVNLHKSNDLEILSGSTFSSILAPANLHLLVAFVAISRPKQYPPLVSPARLKVGSGYPSQGMTSFFMIPTIAPFAVGTRGK